MSFDDWKKTKVYLKANDVAESIDNAPDTANPARDCIHIEYEGERASYLDISFFRTIRVSSDVLLEKAIYPYSGRFPIYSVDEYKATLPAEVVALGGCFTPIYQCEAMWIRFDSNRPFAVKVLIDGINAVTGERADGGWSTEHLRGLRLCEGKSIQNYVVAGVHQSWLHAVTKANGQAMQFAAAPKDILNSVKDQSIGINSIRGIQFEVVPMKRKPPNGHVGVRVVNMKGKASYSNILPTTPMQELMGTYCKRKNLAPSVAKFYHEGEPITENDTVETLDIQDNDEIFVSLELNEDGDPELANKTLHQKSMGTPIPPLVRQALVEDELPAKNWDLQNAVLFHLHLINAAPFKDIAGFNPPQTSILPIMYAQNNCGLFDYFSEEPRSIARTSGDSNIPSRLDTPSSLSEESHITHFAKKDVQLPVQVLWGLKPTFVPVSELKEKTEKRPWEPVDLWGSREFNELSLEQNPIRDFSPVETTDSSMVSPDSFSSEESIRSQDEE